MSQYTPFWAKDGFDKTRPMIIYGYGVFGLGYLRALLAEKVNVKAIFDANPKYHNTYVAGIPILPPDKISSFDRGCNVFISTRRRVYTFTKMFKELGFTDFFYVWSDEYQAIEKHIANKDKYTEIAATNKNRIAQARALFNESKSLEIFDAAIDAYCNANWERLEDLAVPYVNFMPPDIFKIGESEVLADCGAYTGDSAWMFISDTRHSYKYIYSFEPCEMEYLVCVRSFEFNDLPNVEVHRLAVCDVDGFVLFDDCNDTLGAKISDAGNVKVPSIQLDTFFSRENRHQPTIVKMDIEGAEVAALHGMKNIIKNSMPKLAISAYHNFTDYWEVPLTIARYQTGKGYDFFFRHYLCVYDCMLYARPRE